MRLLKNLLRAFVRKGTLTLYDADGGRHVFGGAEPGPAVALRLHDRSLHRRLALNPELVAGEAYMDGTMTFEEGSSLDDLMALFGANRRGLEGHAGQRLLRGLWRRIRRFQQHNPVSQAIRHARHHYDLKDELYELFLDEGMSYSCAYWRDPETETLEQAQDNKLRHIAAKLQLEPGMRVLDIGSGWGALAIYLARHFDVEVTALNPASRQLAASRRRAEAAGVADRIAFVASGPVPFEKLAEVRSPMQNTALFNRLDWVSGFCNEVPYCIACEQLAGIEVPKRAQVQRVILFELTRLDVYGKLNEIAANPGAFGLSIAGAACVTPDVAPYECRNPDEYLFWDGIHPTSAAHGIIAKEAAAALPQRQ